MKTTQKSHRLNQPELLFMETDRSSPRMQSSPAVALPVVRSNPDSGCIAGGLKTRSSEPGLCKPLLATKTRIVVVDSISFQSFSLATLIDSQADLTVCGKTHPDDAVLAIQELNPDAAIINIADPLHLDVVKEIAEKWPTLPILAYSVLDVDTVPERALRFGAKGYVSKHESVEDLLGALRKVIHGEFSITGDLADRIIRAGINGKQPQTLPERLSDRELEVFYCIGQGRRTSQIAKDLGLSIKTIESHRAHIKEKLQVKTAPELVCAAAKWVSAHT